MVHRLLALLFFSFSTTSYCVGQHFYVYDEEKLIDSLVANWPAGLSAEKDRVKLEYLWKNKIEAVEAWYTSMQECRLSPFSQENLEKIQKRSLEEQRLLEGANYLLHNIKPTFDSIVNLAVTKRIHQFTAENDVPLVPAHAVLYKNEGSIDLSYPLVEMLQKTETDQLAIKSYKAWLRVEIIRLELDEWLTGFAR